jgi:hypothetical protein
VESEVDISLESKLLCFDQPTERTQMNALLTLNTLKSLACLMTMASFSFAQNVAPQVDAKPVVIPGYAYGSSSLNKSPVTMQEFESLKRAMLLGEEDIRALKMSREILEGQTDAILDVWYGFVASTPELVYFFKNNKTGQPDGAYLAAVRKRFAQWILDTASANFDQRWLDYQYEIGLRHAPAKKNKTDKADSTKLVNFRYIPALTIPITATLKPFLEKKGATPAQVEQMHAAWVKVVLLQSILWSYPYVQPGQF